MPNVRCSRQGYYECSLRSQLLEALQLNLGVMRQLCSGAMQVDEASRSRRSAHCVHHRNDLWPDHDGEPIAAPSSHDRLPSRSPAKFAGRHSDHARNSPRSRFLVRRRGRRRFLGGLARLYGRRRRASCLDTPRVRRSPPESIPFAQFPLAGYAKAAGARRTCSCLACSARSRASSA